ncbi:MAG: FHA domain-containing protein [Planctomycetota bacterium]
MTESAPPPGNTTPTDYRLLILGDGTVRTITLRGDRWTVGRGQDCTIVLRDPTVSRKHLQLEWVDGQLRFRDLGSNPAVLDGKPIRQGVLRPGQVLEIGLTRLILERREQATPVVTNDHRTVVLSRQISDDDPPATTAHPAAAAAVQVLDRIEWTFADLGDLRDAAEPLLDLARNLTMRRAGLLGRVASDGSLELLAAHTPPGEASATHLPDSVLREARRIARPHLVTTRENDREIDRLLTPLGRNGEGLMVLQGPMPDAPEGQDLLRLAQSLGNVVWHRLQETTERLRLRDEVKRLRFHGTATHNALLLSNRLQSIRSELRTRASKTEPLWLVGEEGTEREDLARYLHAEGVRRQAVFTPWCAAHVPAFRHERDLFGDARDPGGLLAKTRGGTLFLDRLDHLEPALQQRLVEALGSASPDGTPPPVLVAATASARPEQFDRALHELLEPHRIEVPPLRSDRRDVLALAELYLSEMGSNADGSPRLLTDRAKRLLADHSWPGNLRELRLVLESAAAQAGNHPIAPRHLPPGFGSEQGAQKSTPIATLEELERQHILDVLQRTGGNRQKTAQLLGIAVSTLYEKLKRLCLDE